MNGVRERVIVSGCGIIYVGIKAIHPEASLQMEFYTTGGG